MTMSSAQQLGVVLHHLRRMKAVQNRGVTPDRQLLEGFLVRRDEAAFAELVRRHGPMVLNVCRGVLHNLHDAEDVFQATFLVLAQRAGRIRRREAVGSWLCGVAYHLALKVRAAAIRRRNSEERAEERIVADPLMDMTLRELHQVLLEELQHLPEKYRLPLILCYLEGRTQSEAARQLGWDKEVLRGRLNRGRSQLRARLTRRGLALSAGLFVSALTASAAPAALPAVRVEIAAKAALAAVAGQKVGRFVSEQVAALAEGAVRSLFANQGKIVAILVLALGSLITGAGLWARHQLAAGAPAARAAQLPLPKANPAKPRPEVAIEERGDRIAVNGRVLDPDGQPFAGAKLHLTVAYGRSMKPPVRAASGPDGRFHFSFPKTEYFEADWIRERAEPWRWCDIVAAAPGYGPVSVWMADVKKELSLRLVKDARISGRVRDLQGRPVAGADVRVIGPSWAPLLDASTADKQGQFRLAGVGCGREVELRVSSPTIATQWVKVKTQADGAAEVEVIAGPTKPVEGVIRGRDTGKPLDGVEVWAKLNGWARGEDDPHILRAVTDDHGHYRLLGLPKAAAYELTVVPPVEQGYVLTVKQAPDTEGLKPIHLDFELTRGVIVRCRLIDKETGQPVRGSVSYTPLDDNPFWAEANGPDGIGVFPPRVLLYTHAPDKDNFIPFVAYPGPGVLYAFGGGGGRVYLNARLDPEDEKKGHYPGKKGDPLNGFLQIVPGYRRIDTQKTDRPLIFDIVFDPGRTLKGSLVDGDGRPVRGVTASGLKLGSTPRGAARTGEQILATETFTATGLARHQPCTLSFLHRGRKLIGQAAVRPEDKDPLTVRLQPWGTLTGRLIDAEGKPLAGEKIYLEYPNAPDAGMRPPFQTFSTGRDGRFRVEGLLPGLKHELILAGAPPKIRSAPMGREDFDEATRSAGKRLQDLSARSGEVKELGDITVKIVPAPKKEKKNG
jgi:RNA polymerase sigma factor (sigma-70 family)